MSNMLGLSLERLLQPTSALPALDKKESCNKVEKDIDIEYRRGFFSICYLNNKKVK